MVSYVKIKMQIYLKYGYGYHISCFFFERRICTTIPFFQLTDKLVAGIFFWQVQNPYPDFYYLCKITFSKYGIS